MVVVALPSGVAMPLPGLLRGWVVCVAGWRWARGPVRAAVEGEARLGDAIV